MADIEEQTEQQKKEFEESNATQEKSEIDKSSATGAEQEKTVLEDLRSTELHASTSPVEKNSDAVSEPNSESTPASPAHGTKSKIDVLLKAAGDAPIMKKKKWAVDRTKKVGWVIEFIRKFVKLDDADSLFLYVNQAFAPAPDVEVGTLFDHSGTTVSIRKEDGTARLPALEGFL